ncbi:exodeoxyribonuclease V subunit beta [Photobacterium damselae]|uniref:exodeoxyribonuclease V subunit beta n=1 Tax=Photobacterium damselae TaxID=38293 RepID=UPI0040689954
MTQHFKKLNPVTFPLTGMNCIEASAGTGKTFTIATLYIRILLGHGTEATRNPQPADKILVVTFTDAATSELRDRIRSKIIETRKAFKEMHSDDPMLSEIISDLSDKRDDCIDMLIQAERQIDETAIHTIHGFCQRMLKQSAFETGTPFESEFITDDQEIYTNVISDYWRNVFYKLDKNLASIIASKWKSPSDMLCTVKSMIASNVQVLSSHKITKDSISDINNLHASNIERVKKLKNLCADQLDDAIDAIRCSGISKSSFQERFLTKWLEKIGEWIEAETCTYSYPSELEKFSYPFLEEKTKKGVLANHPLLDEITDFITNKPSLHGFIIADAIEKCHKALEVEKAKKQLISFDDLLTNLNEALHSEAGGEVLARTIRESFPIALIDESQDTDNIQYNIFKKIYNSTCTDECNQKYCLTTIGDPKQAIYSFRGADIYTYIDAKNDAQQHFTLDTNWRSTGNMIDAVNTLFSINRQAFLLKGIEYNSVNASPRADKSKLVINGTDAKALNMIIDNAEKVVSKKQYLDTMSDLTAKQISVLLNSPDSYIENDDGAKERVKPQDIAILVRTADEAETIKDTLSKNGIDSVFLSAKKSVYSTHEAKDLLRIVTAMATPTQRNIKSALATALIDLSSDELIEIDEREYVLEQAITEFAEYKKIWHKHGIQAAISKLLEIRNVVERLMSKEQAERKVANIQHIAESLQAQQVKSHLQLVRFLSEKIDAPRNNAEDEQLQLESDRDLVQIITIHKSKGLEYNIVFIPFVLTSRDITETVFHDSNNTPTFAPNPTKEQDKQARIEKMAEDVRLLYVATTRSVFSCFLGIAPLMDGNRRSSTIINKTAVGWLLNKSEYVAPNSLPAMMQDFANHNPKNINLIYVDQADAFVKQNDTKEEVEYTANQCSTRHLNIKNHYVTSYSALVSHHGGDSLIALLPTERDLEIKLEDDEQTTLELSIFNFEKGAKAGTFLHSIFEEIDYNIDVNSEKTNSKILELMAVNGEVRKDGDSDTIMKWSDWLEPIKVMVSSVLDRNLMAGFTDEIIQLKNISMARILPEMEFMFPIEDLNAIKLSELIAKHDPLSRNLPDLEFSDVSGMIKGFIDLTFEANGKFYVLDWKSNHLGDDASVYTIDSIKESMRDHRYDLQYQIYSLALHKFLSTRIPDYDYEKHFGGVFYVYLRGVDTNLNGIFHTKPSLEFLEELGECFCK